uniref:Golgi apparatus protein 1 n=1 Tax=Mucochytrium quahogii TaxID=96639 RepID=A0A7S2WSV3_9STRA|mmetsp:Transcript_12096/g.19693  ORF Transcript_12096/g.19693 Transcript_12096/m.19693 type:complete len:298 (+) Transcript_12096:145-1038(+)|eukprot:CAMPEP_0203749980 /NCGR_PEP_ID=MMETSP0098-20131031/4312_1 /ASSEMBLY_ACC=CAM_ASM_000208 /TAXON_ID=96639 /ORGANISM=" , Strain NY0313808BC1" /LENGTH=297 /DNA_ID=CAMNT_0050639103 /DNA_START=640 /DNA_END=1533 /DNA_ORIENTATION=-
MFFRASLCATLLVSQVFAEEDSGSVLDIIPWAKLSGIVQPLDNFAEIERYATSLFADEVLLSHVFAQEHTDVVFVNAQLVGNEKKFRTKAREHEHSAYCACHKDINRLCDTSDDLSSGAGKISRLGKCLLANVDKLEKQCAIQLENYEIIKMCGDELGAFCNNVEAGQGRVHTCLLNNSDKLSGKCTGYLSGFSEQVADYVDQDPSRGYEDSLANAFHKKFHKALRHVTHHVKHHGASVAVAAALGIVIGLFILGISMVYYMKRRKAMEKRKLEMREYPEQDDYQPLNNGGYQPMLL